MYTVKGKIKQDDVLSEYLPLVRKQALLLHARLPANVELTDLIQAGMIGLLDAWGRYDPTVGTPFLAYASPRIRGAMVDELRVFDWIPRSVRRQARAMEECIQQLEQGLGRSPDEQEIASALGMDMRQYRQLLVDSNNGFLLPLEELVDDDDESTIGRDDPAPLENIFVGQRRQLLINALASLPEREKQLLTLYYQEELNQKEIAAVLGVTESRVSQLHSQAVGRLRAKLRDDLPKEDLVD